MTVEAWVKLDANSTSHILYKRHSASPWFLYQLVINGLNQALFQWTNSSGTYFGATMSSGSLSVGTWYHLVGVRDGTTVRLYVNGSDTNTTTATTSGAYFNSDVELNIGASYSGGTCPDGIIDEVRLSSSARSACWIQTEYNNISSSAGFYTVGTEQDVGGLLTFNSKSVVTSSTAVKTTSATLADDTQASQTFSLTAPKTVLVIYQANSVHGATVPDLGMQNAISVDSMDYAKSWDTGGANYATRNTVFWIGTLASGSHTIKGRFASNTNGSTATVSNRVLLIDILNGDAFLYLDSITTSTSSSSTLVNDPAASFTFTPSGTCKALILYNIANSGTGEDYNGKKAAINIGGADYSQAEKSPGPGANNPDSVFTVWAQSLSAASTTVTGRFANGGEARSVVINRRQLGILMFSDTTLLDTVTSNTQVSTTPTSLVDDTQATINRTTTDARELLVVAMGTKRWNTQSSYYGECYGVNVDGNDRTSSRGSSYGDYYSDSAATAWAETLAAGSHTIKGRLSNNTGTYSAAVSSRRIVALWFPSGTGTGDVTLAEHAAGQETDALSTQHSVTSAELFAFKLTNNLASGVTVDQIQFQLSGVTGFSQSDFANLAIYVDANNDGAIGGGETTTVGGSGVVNFGVTTISFSTDFTISGSATVNYILKGDVSNLVAGDTVTMALGTSNVALTSGTMGGSAATNVTHTADAAGGLTQIHYRWRNDDGKENGFGTGADGSATISASRNINTDVIGSNRSTNADGIVTTVSSNPTGTAISVASSTGLAAGDEILLINMRGASGDTADVGNYEFLEIDSVSGTTLYLKSSVQKSYDGTTFSNQRVVVQRVPQWTNVTIQSGVTLTANAWSGTSGGIIVFRATGTVDVQSGGIISANALGYLGGSSGSSIGGTNGESYDGSVGSGGTDTSDGTGGGAAGTSGGGGSSNYAATSVRDPKGVKGFYGQKRELRFYAISKKPPNLKKTNHQNNSKPTDEAA